MEKVEPPSLKVHEGGSVPIIKPVELESPKAITAVETEKVDTTPSLPEKAPVAAPVSAGDNETITWNFLMAQGFSRHQTAGIMGNLQQEHGFQTSGDGLAQWTDSRKANMLAMPDPYNINSQLQYLMTELNGGYASVKANLLAAGDVVTATIIFQDQFERCGDCRQSQRIGYSHSILARH